jgi:Skp family chaperone for outer membrane proteins
VLHTLKEDSGMIVVVRRLVIGLALVTLSGARAASAQQPQSSSPGTPPGAFRIAFVDARRALQSMPGYAKAESTWTKELQTAQIEGQRMQAAFDSTVAVYQQSSAMLSPSAKTAREKVLNAQNDSLQTKLQALQERVQGRERELLAPMQTRLSSIIDGLRAEGNYALIIDLGNPNSQNIVSYDKALDITDRVLRRLLPST